MSGGVINYTYTISLHLGYPRQDDVCYQCRAADKQHLDAFLRRAVGLRAGLYPADGPNLHQLVSDGDEALFARILANQNHVLRQLLPNTSTHNYGQ